MPNGFSFIHLNVNVVVCLNAHILSPELGYLLDISYASYEAQILLSEFPVHVRHVSDTDTCMTLARHLSDICVTSD